MCGIAGFLDHHNIITETHLKNASATLIHRGASTSGIIFEKKEHYTLGIANESFAILDLSEKAQQPLTSACGNYSITFNGTIFNYLALRETLIKYGVTFSTLSETEVILENYKKWGYKSFEKLDGSFAFAIIDRKLNQLLVARDEIGAKPIYYIKNKHFYCFASEIRVLLSFPTVEKKINKNSVRTIFKHGYFIGEETIYEDIFKFKKGTLTTIDLHSGNSYNSPLVMKKPQHINYELTENEILANIQELLTESILKRNATNVNVGILLDGDYDTAYVAAILQKNQTKRIKTFSVAFKYQKLNKTPQTQKIAAFLKTNHQEYYLDKTEALRVAKNLVDAFDEPVGNWDAIPLLFVAEKVHKGVKVLLSAAGCDELFGGHTGYAKAIKLHSLEKAKIPKVLLNILKFYFSKTDIKLKAALQKKNLLNNKSIKLPVLLVLLKEH